MILFFFFIAILGLSICIVEFLMGFSCAAENYLLGLCEGGREKELSQLFDITDIMKFASMNTVAAMFKSLGKLQMEAFVEKFLVFFKARGKFMS